MDKRYEVYALADRHFYETPDRLSADGQEAAPLAAFLGGCPVVRSEGRLFPVEVEHLPAPDTQPLHSSGSCCSSSGTASSLTMSERA